MQRKLIKGNNNHYYGDVRVLLQLLTLSCSQIKVVGPDNKPVANEAVYLFVGSSLKLELTTDVKGVALFSLSTSLWKDSVHLKVGYIVMKLVTF